MWDLGCEGHSQLHDGDVMAVFIPTDFESQVRVLLDLADNPNDVATTTDFDKLAVIIPDELLERYEQYLSLQESSPPREPKKKGARQ